MVASSRMWGRAQSRVVGAGRQAQGPRAGVSENVQLARSSASAAREEGVVLARRGPSTGSRPAWCSAASAPQSAPARRSRAPTGAAAPCAAAAASPGAGSCAASARTTATAADSPPRRHGRRRRRPAGGTPRQQPRAGGGEMLEQRIGRDGVGLGQVAETLQPGVDARGVGPGDRLHDAALGLDAVGLEIAEEAEVQQSHAAVVAQHAVVGVWVTRDDPITPREAAVEAKAARPPGRARPRAAARSPGPPAPRRSR